MKSLTIAAALSTASAFDSITIEENGIPKTLYVARAYQEAVVAAGSSVDVAHGARVYLTTSDALGPNNFYAPNVNGGSWEYDVDLSESGCSCNAAFYLV